VRQTDPSEQFALTISKILQKTNVLPMRP
jgi:hypothetical protein